MRLKAPSVRGALGAGRTHLRLTRHESCANAPETRSELAGLEAFGRAAKLRLALWGGVPAGKRRSRSRAHGLKKGGRLVLFSEKKPNLGAFGCATKLLLGWVTWRRVLWRVFAEFALCYVMRT